MITNAAASGQVGTSAGDRVLPTVADLRWRIDVTVSTSAMSRVFKPTVLMELVLSDGNIKTFQCSLDQFHQMRFNTVQLLRDMESLEQQPSVKANLAKEAKAESLV